MLDRRRKNQEAKKAAAAAAAEEGDAQQNTSSTTPSDVETTGKYVEICVILSSTKHLRGLAVL